MVCTTRSNRDLCSKMDQGRHCTRVKFICIRKKKNHSNQIKTEEREIGRTALGFERGGFE